MKYNFTILRSFVVILLAVGMVMGASVKEGWGQQTFYAMSSGNYNQGFSDIVNWTNDYASGIGASNWRKATSVTTSLNTNNTVFVTGTTGGVQKGTEAIVFLATGTNAGATDLLLNFSGRDAGSLSFDYAKITNTVNDGNPRSSDLKIQYSLDDGLTFTDLAGYAIPRINNNSTVESGTLNIALPVALNNKSQVVLRFYFWHNAQTGGSGSRPKWSIDNVSVTSTESPSPSLTTDPIFLTGFSYVSGSGPSAAQSFEISGSNLDGSDVLITAPANFEVSTAEAGTYTSTLTLAAYDGTDTDIWVRLAAGLTPGDYSGNVAISGGGATAINVAVSGVVLKDESTNHISGLTASPGIPPYRAIDLNWTDASGGTEPDGYLVLASTADDIANPVDGVEPVAGMMTKYVNQGVEEVSFADLAPSTLHYFKVFPYTNSGTDINYKTTVSVPAITAATGTIPSGYFVDFEGDGETKTGYDVTNNTVNLNGIDWDLKQALIGTESAEFKFNNRSVRMRGYGSTNMAMIEDKQYGAGRVSFYYKRYGTDTQTPFIVEYSDDAGDSWTQAGSAFTATDNIQYFNEEVNVAGNVRIRIGTETAAGTSNRRMNIDDISITNYFDGSPIFLVSDNELTGFEYVEGFGPSDSQSFSFSAMNITEDVSLASSGNFKISLVEVGPFQSGPIVLSPVGGEIPDTDVYVQMVDELLEGSYSGSTILASGATISETVSLSGRVTNYLDIPYINAFRASNDLNNALDKYFSVVGQVEQRTAAGGYLYIPLNAYLETPVIDFTQYSGIQVQFNATTFGGSTGQTLSTKISSDGGNTYSIIGSEMLINSYLTYTYTIDLTGIYNTQLGKLRFEMTDGTNQCRLRDFSITLIPVATPAFDPPAWTYLAPIDVDIETTTVEADLYYSTTSAAGPWITYSGSIPVSESTTIWAYGSNDGMAHSEVAEAEYVIATLVPVNNIAELRSMYSPPQAKSGPAVYQLTNEVFLTLQSSFRGQKYIQDATAAILIDDDAGVIVSTYELYDGIIGITGALENFNGMLQFVPIADPGAANSTLNDISVVNVETKTLSSISSADQAKLLKVLSVSFNQTGNFPLNQAWNIPISDPSDPGTGFFRTQYFDQPDFDYMGQPIPQVPKHIIAVMNESNGVYRIIARNLNDFSNTLIASINPAGIVGVPFGTSEANALAMMPETTTIVDDGGASHVVTLTWTYIENYDPDRMGNYKAYATFGLPEGVDQSDPETELIAEGTVAVSAPIPLSRLGIYLAMAAMLVAAVYLVRRRIA